MSSINIINIVCKNAKDKFKSQFQFEIVFECLTELSKDIEWKLIYIGKADDPKYDQELESIIIGPLLVGQMKFDFDTDFPDPKKIPAEDLLGITAIILTCSYNNQEFFRAGYYVNNVYDDEVIPENVENYDFEKIFRYILVDKPRVTNFEISWDSSVESIPGFSSINQNNNDYGMFDGSFNPQKDLDNMIKK